MGSFHNFRAKPITFFIATWYRIGYMVLIFLISLNLRITPLSIALKVTMVIRVLCGICESNNSGGKNGPTH